MRLVPRLQGADQDGGFGFGAVGVGHAISPLAAVWVSGKIGPKKVH
jgi:hypothetical protein